MRIVILGASGNAGRAIATLLAPELSEADELVVAGRDAVRLSRTRAAMAGPAVVREARLDAADPAAVRSLIRGADLVVVTVSRPDLVGTLARLVLDAGADWLDTLSSSSAKLAVLRPLAPEIEASGCCFVTDAGFHPGVPAALVRWAAGQLGELREADVFAGMRLDWRADTLSDSTIVEMLHEFTGFDLSTWRGGQRRRLRWSECPRVDFGAPIGTRYCVPMPLAEMDELPADHPGLVDCGFYIGGFGPAMDYGALPILMAMSRFRGLQSPTVRLARWSLGRLASYPPPHRMVIQLKAVGTDANGPATASVRISGDDGYLLTAAPAVACLRRIRDGSIRRPGLHHQAHLVDPQTLLEDLAGLGLQVEVEGE